MKPRAILGLMLVGAIAVTSSAGITAQSASQNNADNSAQHETLPYWSDPELAKFVYSVVSIKPFKADDNNGHSLGTSSSPDGYTAAFPLHGLIYEAYRTDQYRVTGGTGWVLSEMWLVEAKMDPEIMEALQKLPREKRRIARQHMLQVLLRDYFKVVVRTEIREVPAYDLVVAKKGSKLIQAADPKPENQKLKWAPDGTVQSVTALGQPVDSVLAVLRTETDRPVYNKTGLTGIYDYVLKFTPNKFLMDPQPAGDTAPLPAQTAPPIEKAIEEQLGLRLSPTTGNVEFIIIDHAERPAGN
jgi:uncharacterized protein (TIGR03435 family)